MRVVGHDDDEDDDDRARRVMDPPFYGCLIGGIMKGQRPRPAEAKNGRCRILAPGGFSATSAGRPDDHTDSPFSGGVVDSLAAAAVVDSLSLSLIPPNLPSHVLAPCVGA